MSDPDGARRALKLLDLTDLSAAPSDHAVDDLCRKALTPHGPVAAVCVWPQMVARARDALRDSPVRIATVLNFPAGTDDVEHVTDDAEEALHDGAQEIDLVMPYGAFLRGEIGVVREMIEAVRDVVDGGRSLKVILETGALGEAQAIEAASRLAVEGGADFLKSSTGTTGASATPEAARAMLGVIKTSDRPVGLKVSGGIRTVEEAVAYLALADRIMGPAWASPATFRIGASALYDVLLDTIEGRATGLSS